MDFWKLLVLQFKNLGIWNLAAFFKFWILFYINLPFSTLFEYIILLINTYKLRSKKRWNFHPIYSTLVIIINQESRDFFFTLRANPYAIPWQTKYKITQDRLQFNPPLPNTTIREVYLNVFSVW